MHGNQNTGLTNKDFDGPSSVFMRGVIKTEFTASPPPPTTTTAAGGVLMSSRVKTTTHTALRGSRFISEVTALMLREKEELARALLTIEGAAKFTTFKQSKW